MRSRFRFTAMVACGLLAVATFHHQPAQAFRIIESFGTDPFPGTFEFSDEPEGLAFIGNDLVVADDIERTLFFYNPQTTNIFPDFVGVYFEPFPPIATETFLRTLTPGGVEEFLITGRTPGTPYIAIIDNDLGSGTPDTTLGAFSDEFFADLTQVNDDGNIFFGDGHASMLSGAVNPDGSISLKVSGWEDLDFDGLDDFPPSAPHPEQGDFELIVDIGIAGNDDAEGLAFDGTDLWITHDEGDVAVGFGAYLDRYDPFTGTLLQRFDLFHTTGGTVLEAEGLAFDGNNIWLSADENLYELDPSDGSLLRSFGFAGRNIEGLAWDGNRLILGDSAFNTLLFFDTGAEAVVGRETGLPGRPDGLAFDGEHIWFSDKTTETIYRVQVPSPGALALMLPALVGVGMARRVRATAR